MYNRTVISLKKSFFFRLIFTNLLVITVILVLILVIQNALFLNKYKEDLEKGHRKTLEYMQGLIDNEIRSLHRLSNGISVDRDLSYFKLTEEPHSAYTAVMKLKNYYSANTFINQIILSFYEDDYLYTSEGSYDKENFIAEYFSSDDYRANLEISHILNGGERTEIISSDDSLFFNYQFPSSAIDGTGVIIYQVKKSTLHGFLRFGADGANQNNMIFHNGRDCLVSSYPLDDKWLSLIRNELDSLESSRYSGNIRLDDRDYLIQISRSEISSLKYVSIVSAKTALEPFYRSRLSLLYSLIIIYIISIILSFIVSLRNYDPFRKIKNLLLKGADGQEIVNEVQWMENTIQSMNRVIGDRKLAYRNNTIDSLIQKRYESLDQFIYDMEQSGSYLPFRNFGFLIIQTESAEDKGKITALLSRSQEDFTIIPKDSIQTRQLLFLYNTSRELPELNALLKEKFRMLHEENALSLTAGVGSPGRDLQGVTNSLVEALSAMEYKFVLGKNKIIFHSDLSENRDFERPLSTSELSSINYAIYSGDMDRIDEAIRNIIESHNIRNLSLLNAKSLTYQIANQVLRTIDEILEKKGLPLSLSSSIQQHIFMGSVDEMVESIRLIFKDLETLLTRNKPQKSGLTVMKAKEIILSDLGNPQLSVQVIAAELGVSLSYLSRIFKSSEGKTILNYITERRMDKARKMLAESDLSIKEIMGETGYLDLSSFSRKFKSLTGYTPGQYRKQNFLPAD